MSERKQNQGMDDFQFVSEREIIISNQDKTTNKASSQDEVKLMLKRVDQVKPESGGNITPVNGN